MNPTYFFLFRPDLHGTIRREKYWGRLRQTMLDTYCCLDRVVLERISQELRRLEVCKVNGALSTPGYLLALLQKFVHVPRTYTENVQPKHCSRYEKWTKFVFCARSRESTLQKSNTHRGNIWRRSLQHSSAKKFVASWFQNGKVQGTRVIMPLRLQPCCLPSRFGFPRKMLWYRLCLNFLVPQPYLHGNGV